MRWLGPEQHLEARCGRPTDRRPRPSGPGRGWPPRPGRQAGTRPANRTPSAVSSTGRLAPRHQQLEVGLGLQAGQGGVEQVEVGEAPLVAGPGQAAGDVVRRAGTGRQHVAAEPQPGLVVGEQLVDAGVGGRRERAVRRQQREVGQPADLGEGGHEVAQRLAHRHRLEADGRRDRGQHVVAGEQQPGGAVGEDVVALRVAGGVHGVEGARPDLDRVVALEPGVGIGPVRQVGPALAGRRGPLLGDGEGPRGPQHVQRRVRVARPGAVELVERGPLPGAEADVGAELARDHRRQRVVVAVHVGDQEVGDVAEAVPDLLEAGLQQRRGPPRWPTRRRPGSGPARSRARTRSPPAARRSAAAAGSGGCPPRPTRPPARPRAARSPARWRARCWSSSRCRP